MTTIRFKRHVPRRALRRLCPRGLITVAIAAAVLLAGCAQTSSRFDRSTVTDPASALPLADKLHLKKKTAILIDEPREHTVGDLLSVAQLSEQGGQLDQAESLYKAAAEREPENPRPYQRLGVMRAKEGKFEEADEYLTQALLRKPDDPEILGDLGYSYYLQSRLDEAEQAFRRALEQKPRDATLLNNLAMVLGEKRCDDECMALLRQAGNEKQAYTNMGFIFAQRGDVAGAKACYSRALTLDQSLRPAAEAMIQLAQYEDAHRDLPARELPGRELPGRPLPPRELVAAPPPEAYAAQPAAVQAGQPSLLPPNLINCPANHAMPMPIAQRQPANPTGFAQQAGFEQNPAWQSSAVQPVAVGFDPTWPSAAERR